MEKTLHYQCDINNRLFKDTNISEETFRREFVIDMVKQLDIKVLNKMFSISILKPSPDPNKIEHHQLFRENKMRYKAKINL